MKILVTGGAGYIGGVTVRQLLNEGFGVGVFDNLERGHKEAIDGRAEFFQGDLRRLAEVQRVLTDGKFDAVVHFAGYIESGESMKDPLNFFENNLSAGINLLKAMEAAGVQRIIFSSTAGIYGAGQPPYTEESPASPTSNYSLSKYLFEQVLKSACLARGFKAVVLRYFNAAGAGPDGTLGEAHEPETHLIPLAIKAALGRRSSLTLFGTDYPTPDGTAVRDYIHVEDLARAHGSALAKIDSLPSSFSLYNVGTGRGHSNREVINLVKEISRVDFSVVFGPRRPGDWDVSFAEAAKIQRELNWRAKRGLREIIESAFLWHRLHPKGYDSN